MSVEPASWLYVPRRRPRRHGIVLLVVLTLLALFIVICTTFLLLAGQFRRSADSQARDAWYGDPPQKLLDMAMYQVLRGTSDQRSPLRGHDLLGDLYGLDGFIGYAWITAASGDQISMVLPIPEVNVQSTSPLLYQIPGPDPFYGDQLHLRTVANRNAIYFYKAPTNTGRQIQTPNIPNFYAGQWLTIIDAPDDSPELRNVTFRIISNSIAKSPPPNPLPQNDSNNNPYWYHDFVVTWPNNTYQIPGLNRVTASLPKLVRILVNGRPFNGDGRATYPDESYDYWDDKNLFLANATDPTDPSFQPAPRSSGVAVQVDTDGDNVNDAIWRAIGLPRQTSRDGRLVEPRVAIRCIDLDGRLNINFIGSNYHTQTPPQQGYVYGGNTNPDQLTRNLPFANTIPFPGHGQSMGHGPADINPLDLFAQIIANEDSSLSAAQVQQFAVLWQNQLFNGVAGPPVIPGRHGLGQTPGIVGKDPLTDRKFGAYNSAYPSGPIYGWPTYFDFHGSLRTGFDRRGMPMFEPRYLADPIIDATYEISARAPRGRFPSGSVSSEVTDQLFSPAEFEPLLRLWDWDTPTFPSRLSSLTPTLPNGRNPARNSLLRASITTESSHIPVIEFQKGRGDGTFVASFVELVDAKIDQYGGMPPPGVKVNWLIEMTRPYDSSLPVTSQADNPPTVYNPLVGPIISAELSAGFPLNVNRPFLLPGDRQRMATQLFLLMCTVGNIDMTNQNAVEQAAQWAINVVDMRDPDDEMTPFEFDINPFNGWDVDGVPFGNPSGDRNPSERRLVWGCERPELLITESLAYHDLRWKKDAMGNNEQEYRPRGSLYVELYNPWASKYYQSSLNPWPNGVNLSATNAAGEPVWRLRIETNEAAGTKAYVYFTNLPNIPPPPAPPPSYIVPGRTYYTTVPVTPVAPGNYAVVGSAGWLLNPKQWTNPPPGNAPDVDGDNRPDYVSTIGMQTTDISPGMVNYGSARRIQFSEIGGTTYLTYVDGIRVFPPGVMPPVTSRAVPGVVVNGFVDATGGKIWRSLNLSEPMGGYPTDANPTDPNVFIDITEQKYTMPRQPVFDDKNALDNLVYTIRLERLANPNAPYDATANPYRTIDRTTGGHVRVFNGNNNDPDVEPPVFAGRERANASAMWSSRTWNNSTGNNTNAPGPTHFVSTRLETTLGYLNTRLGSPVLTPLTSVPSDPINGGNEIPPDYYVGAPTTPFPWLTWLNRPYISSAELIQVPRYDSEELLPNFNTPSNYPGTEPQLHLFPFNDQNNSPGATYFHVLRYTTSGSNYLDTETYVGASSIPLAARPAYPAASEPGRVNVNTIPNGTVWNSLWNGVEVSSAGAGFGGTWIPLFPTDTTGMDPNRIESLRRASPFSVTSLNNGVAADPWFKLFHDKYPNAAYPHLNGNENWSERYRGLNRMMNLTTTHSNVFALWITLGYFDVVTGQELGAETGEIRRHRAFYIIDRSIPVGYEPGQDYNVDRTILLRRFIE